MFGFHIAFALNLLCFAMGIVLIVWSTQLVGKGKNIAAVFGYIIAILAAMVLVCTLYYGFKGWYFFHHYEKPMLQRMQQQNQMMPGTPRQGGMGMQQQPQRPFNPNSRANDRPVTQDPSNMMMSPNQSQQAPKMQTPPQPQSSNRLHKATPSVKQAATMTDFHIA